METKQVSEQFSISDQLTPDDVAALHARGVKTLVCNRPDQEVAGQPDCETIAERARALGIDMQYIPVVHDTINSRDVRQFDQALREAAEPVHAYCRSGLRSLALWSLTQVHRGADIDATVARATALGFDFKTFATRFAPVIAELTGAFDNYPTSQHCEMLIVGAGAGGIALAASLLKRTPTLKITLVDPADTHYYQPAFTLVGAGEYAAQDTSRPMHALIPAGVHWIKAAVTNFLPEQSSVVLDNHSLISYDRLCVCTGLKLNWDAVEGLRDTLGENGVTSNYLPALAPYTWQLVKELQKGKALFTQPPMPIKCAGAPQKAMYLSADHWQRSGRLGEVSVHFYNAGAVLFGVKDFVPALEPYVQRYQAQLHFGHNLVKVDGPRRIATFATVDPSGNTTRVDVAFDMLHVCPPQCAPDCIRNSAIADRTGWVDVDRFTLRHKAYANVWALGDCTNTPNAKTAAAVRKQVPVVADNIVLDLQQRAAAASYDGYGACPLTVERGRVVLAEFAYEGKLMPTFPVALVDGRKATRRAWWLKRYLMPWLYWHLMLKGHEPLAKPRHHA